MLDHIHRVTTDRLVRNAIQLVERNGRQRRGRPTLNNIWNERTRPWQKREHVAAIHEDGYLITIAHDGRTGGPR